MKIQCGLFRGGFVRRTVLVATSCLFCIMSLSARAQLEEVIVVAEKTEASLQDLSQSVSVITQDAMSAVGVTDFRGIANMIPNVHIGFQEGNIEVGIRGVVSANNTELGDAAVGTYIDGVYVARPRGIPDMMFDLERVEVLRGPQGTLFGRNSNGGIVNIIPAKPKTDGFEGSFEAQYGDYNSAITKGMVNIPLVQDRLALRLATMTSRHDAYMENNGLINPSVDGASDKDAQGYRATLLLDNESWYLKYTTDSVTQAGQGTPGLNEFNNYNTDGTPITQAVNMSGAVVSGQAQFDPRSIPFTIETDLDGQANGYALEYGLDIGDSMDLTVQYAEREMDFFQIQFGLDVLRAAGLNPCRAANAAAATCTGVNPRDYINDFNQSWWDASSSWETLEARLHGVSGAVEWTVGAFSFEETQDVLLAISCDDCGSWMGISFDQVDTTSESQALFAQAEISLTDSLRVIAGFRTTDEDKRRLGFTRFPGNEVTFQPWALVRDTNGDAKNDAPPNWRNGSTGFTFDGQGQISQFGILDFGSVDHDGDPTTPELSGENLILSRTASGNSVNPADANNNGLAEDDYTDYRLGLELDLSDSAMAYLNLSTGHKASGFNDGDQTDASFALVQAGLFSYTPEKINATEIGIKSELADGNIRLNASYFLYDYEDQQIATTVTVNQDNDGDPTNDPSFLVTQNAATSSVDGLEIDGTFLLGSNFLVSANVSWLNAEFDSFEAADSRQGFDGSVGTMNFGGNPLLKAPELSMGLNATHEISLSSGAQVVWTLSALMKDDHNLDIFNDPASKVEGYTRWDGSINYINADGDVEIGLVGTNLSDETYKVSHIRNANSINGYYNDPKVLAVRVKLHF